MDTNVRLGGIAINSQQRRRWVVVLLYLSYGGIVAAFYLAHSHAKLLLLIALPFFALLGMTFWGLSQIVHAYAIPSGSSAKLPLPRSDERQTQVRDKSFVVSYQILSGISCLAILYAMLAGDFGWPVPSAQGMQAPLFGFILLSATLPSAVIAWTEPDPQDDLSDEVITSIAGHD